jgi:transposase
MMSKIEVLTGPERRRRWSETEKSEILAAASVPGVTIAAVARQYDVLPQQVYAWRRKARTDSALLFQESAPPFLELPMPNDDASEAAGEPTEVVITLSKGRSLRVQDTVDPDRLRLIIQSIERV